MKKRKEPEEKDLSLAKQFPHLLEFGCSACNQLGYTLDFLQSDRERAVLDICACAKKFCKCGNETPFYAIVEDDSGKSALAPCPIYPLHKKIEKIQKLFLNAEIPWRYSYKFYNSFEFKHYRDNAFIKKIQSILPPIWEDKKSRIPEGIFLTGGAGSGKTHLAAVIINELIFRHAVPALFLKTTRSLDKLRDTYNVGSASYGQGTRIEDLYKKIPVLVLDDLGAQKDSTWVEETLYDIIDTRYEEGLSTIITSNHSFKELEEFGGGRISSRLTEISKVIVFPDKDYRKILGAKKNHEPGTD